MAKMIKNGMLPESGGIMDQPWALMQYVNFAANEIRSHEIANMGALSPLLNLVL